jgi:tetratricopeptide (TPR) repeat protein
MHHQSAGASKGSLVQRNSSDSRNYRAFISYSHVDSGFAHRLHRKLERFTLPKGVVPPGGVPNEIAESRKLGRIFIDRAELVAGESLTDQVMAALASSEVLIVIASPAARKSRWVAMEIAQFRQLRPDRPVLFALIDGEPESSFPDAFLPSGGATQEPLAADFRRHGDGFHLALLKLVAGLAGLPLDRLVQRDAQNRYRRVMAVTAVALLVALITTGLAIAAIMARREAQRQRLESEALVEFMLSDLRGRLKGVGRLDIMDSVNARVMTHYSRQSDLASLPSDSMGRRAKMLVAMGEDDMARRNMAGAKREFDEAYHITKTMLDDAPNDPERVFNHAQSEYWVGYVIFKQNDLPTTKSHWLAYRDLAQKLVQIDGKSVTYRRELGYAESNLCAFLQSSQKAKEAIPHCAASVAELQTVAESLPQDVESQRAYTNNLGWLADAEMMLGHVDRAIEIRRKQIHNADDMQMRFPNNMQITQGGMLARWGFCQNLITAHKTAEARQIGEDALKIADQLVQHDPENKYWLRTRDKIINTLKNLSDI